MKLPAFGSSSAFGVLLLASSAIATAASSTLVLSLDRDTHERAECASSDSTLDALAPSLEATITADLQREAEQDYEPKRIRDLAARYRAYAQGASAQGESALVAWSETRADKLEQLAADLDKMKELEAQAEVLRQMGHLPPTPEPRTEEDR